MDSLRFLWVSIRKDSYHRFLWISTKLRGSGSRMEKKKKENNDLTPSCPRIPDSLNVTCTDCADVLRSVLRFKCVS
jgi:hypothetical protein